MEENKKKLEDRTEEPEKVLKDKQQECDENKHTDKEEKNHKNQQTENSEDKQEDKRYQVLVDLDENLWTYGSPVLFESGVLERDRISKRNRLTLKFTNIFEEEIRNVNIIVYASDDEGNVEQIEHTYAALGQTYLSSKGRAAKITVQNEEATKFVIQVVSVDFENGRTWAKDEAICESVGALEDVEAFAQAKLKDYEDQYISGLEEIGKDNSVSIGNGINLLNRIIWYKDAAEQLRDAKRKFEIVKQNEERRQVSEEKRTRRQQAVKKRYMMSAVAAVAVVLIAVIAVVAFFIPNGKYKEAKKQLNAKKYEQAIASFDKLNGFLNSEEYLAEAYYNLGLQALDKNDEKKASEYFKKGNDADKDSQHGLMSGSFLDYYAGREALQKKDYNKAMKLFQASVDAATDITLINKASAGMAQIHYLQKQYEKAWNTIKNVYLKDASFREEYGTYGYDYAKMLVEQGKTKEGMEIYNTIAKFTKSANLNESVYNQAVKLGEQGKIADAMKLLSDIKGSYKKANKLYEHMYQFNDKVQYWIGLWKHHAKVNGEKKTYRIYISQVLYKGEMCLKIKDKNNDYLGFETVISSKNRVTQIQIGTYQLHFKLKKFHDQKFTYTLKGGTKMIRELKYDGEKYKSKYKKKMK